MGKLIKVSEATKYDKNPFLNSDVITINRGKKQIVVGSTKNVLVNTETSEVEAIAMLHKYKEVDKEQFVKLFIGEVKSLFDLSRTGLKVFGYILQAMRINTDEIYLSIPKLMEYCGYKHRSQVYKGLSELISNKIIAISVDPNIWFVNPNIVFNGDRIAFIKEYRLKKTSPPLEQSEMKLDS